MATANDPFWLFILLYTILIITFISAVIRLFQRKDILFSIVMIIIVPAHHVLQILSSMGRDAGVTEMQHWFSELFQLNPWSLIVLVSYILIVFWWFMILNVRKKEVEQSV